jgi:hypothetical protein
VSGMSDSAREPAVRAFCSYAHKDDQTLAGAIRHIVEDVRSFHEAETGRGLEIFFDRTDIGWGQDLRSAIGDSVENATVFVPMITARYFQSDGCRDEILSFYGKCRSLGVTELVLPIVLAGRSQIRDDSDDEVVRIVSGVRFIDWTEIWPAGRGSPAWNLGITYLVRRFVELQERVETHLASTVVKAASESLAGEPNFPSSASPLIAQFENSRADATTTLTEVSQVVDELRRLFVDLADEFDRVSVSNQYGVRAALDRIGSKYALRGHAIGDRARATSERLLDYDDQLRGMAAASRRLDSREQTELVRDYLSKLRLEAQSLVGSIRTVDAMSGVLRKYADASVGLRRALAPARAALQTVRDMARLIDGWESMEV